MLHNDAETEVIPIKVSKLFARPVHLAVRTAKEIHLKNRKEQIGFEEEREQDLSLLF